MFAWADHGEGPIIFVVAAFATTTGFAFASYSSRSVEHGRHGERSGRSQLRTLQHTGTNWNRGQMKWNMYRILETDETTVEPSLLCTTNETRQDGPPEWEREDLTFLYLPGPAP